MEEKMGRIIIDGKILDLDKIDLVELKKIQKTSLWWLTVGNLYANIDLQFYLR